MSSKHLPEAVRQVLRRQGGGASTRDLLAVGATKNDLDRLVRGQLLTRTGRGRYAIAVRTPPESDTRRQPWADRRRQHLLQLSSLLRAVPDATAGFRSAAIAWNLPVSAIPDTPEIFRVRGRAHIRHARTVAAHLGVADRSIVDGLNVTTLERTIVDVALDLPVPDALITVDAAWRRGVAPGHVKSMLQARGSVRGTGRARRTLEWADGHSETPIESKGRGHLLLHGVPEPKCNVWIQLGNRSFRVDELWDELGIVGEADGRVKYEGQLPVGDTLWKEKVRQEWLENEVGLLVVRWTGREIQCQPQVVADRWRRTSARRQQLPWHRSPDLITWQDPLPRRK